MTPSTYESIVIALSAFVGALGVLFAVGAIAAGYLVYRQGREFRTTLDETIRSYRELLEESITDANSQITALSATVTGQIDEAKRELGRAGTEDRKRIDAEIRRLIDLRTAVEASRRPTMPAAVESAVHLSIGGDRPQSKGARELNLAMSGMMEVGDQPAQEMNGMIVCKKCIRAFGPREYSAGPKGHARCPRCGTLNRWTRATK